MKRTLTLLALTLLGVAFNVLAQDTANIMGTVMDPTTAVIPNVRVIVENPSKGLRRELLSNTAGEYAAARIPIGDYVISAEATGFLKLVRSGITLQVGQTLRVDMQLTPCLEVGLQKRRPSSQPRVVCIRHLQPRSNPQNCNTAFAQRLGGLKSISLVSALPFHLRLGRSDQLRRSASMRKPKALLTRRATAGGGCRLRCGGKNATWV